VTPTLLRLLAALLCRPLRLHLRAATTTSVRCSKPMMWPAGAPTFIVSSAWSPARRTATSPTSYLGRLFSPARCPRRLRLPLASICQGFRPGRMRDEAVCRVAPFESLVRPGWESAGRKREEFFVLRARDLVGKRCHEIHKHTRYGLGCKLRDCHLGRLW